MTDTIPYRLTRNDDGTISFVIANPGSGRPRLSTETVAVTDEQYDAIVRALRQRARRVIGLVGTLAVIAIGLGLVNPVKHHVFGTSEPTDLLAELQNPFGLYTLSIAFALAGIAFLALALIGYPVARHDIITDVLNERSE